MSRLLGSLLFSAVLLVPAAMQAQDHGHDDQDHTNTTRYYDSSHKDYHQWNSNEDTAYHQYAKEHHMGDRDFNKLSKKQQSNYWAWRHDHPDTH